MEAATVAPIAMVGVSKSYGSLRALIDFDVHVQAGEVVGLLGQNGAGKTTAMRTLLGYLHADEGSATVLGGDPRTPEVRSQVGYLPGDFRLGTRQRVGTILTSYNKLRGGQHGSRIEELARRLDLDTHRSFDELSKGNRQKVGVIAALMHDPDVLVLDEPTSGLDPLMQRTVLELVEERRSAGAAVLFSSHILSEVEDIADRVTIVRHGRTVASGDTQQLSAQAGQTLEFVLRSSPPLDLLDELADVTVLLRHREQLRVRTTGTTERLFSLLAPYGIIRVDSSGHELDELFYELYRSSGDDQ